MDERTLDRNRRAVKAVMKCIARYSSRDRITLNQLSRELGMSSSTVSRRLALYGIDFRGLPERIRVSRALTMLASDPEAKVEAVALLSGWRSRGNFYGAVRRATGLGVPILRRDLTLLRAAMRRLRITRRVELGAEKIDSPGRHN